MNIFKKFTYIGAFMMLITLVSVVSSIFGCELFSHSYWIRLSLGIIGVVGFFIFLLSWTLYRNDKPSILYAYAPFGDNLYPRSYMCMVDGCIVGAINCLPNDMSNEEKLKNIESCILMAFRRYDFLDDVAFDIRCEMVDNNKVLLTISDGIEKHIPHRLYFKL